MGQYGRVAQTPGASEARLAPLDHPGQGVVPYRTAEHGRVRFGVLGGGSRLAAPLRVPVAEAAPHALLSAAVHQRHQRRVHLTLEALQPAVGRDDRRSVKQLTVGRYRQHTPAPYSLGCQHTPGPETGYLRSQTDSEC